MEKWFLSDWFTIRNIILSAVIVYVAIVVFTRVFGKRSFSKMSSFDFAATIAIGSIIASTLLSASVSLIEGLSGLLTVYILQALIAYLRKFNTLRKLVDNDPLLLMEGRYILYENLQKARVTEDDLRAKLREANVLELKDVRAVVFESTGDISVLHTSDSNKKLDTWLLEGVDRN